MRHGFVSNSSSTSFTIMCKGDPTEEMFRITLGIEKSSVLNGWHLDEFVEHCLEKDECFNYHECNSMKEFVGRHYEDDKKDLTYELENMEEKLERYNKEDASRLDKAMGVRSFLLHDAFKKGWKVHDWDFQQGGEYGIPKPGYATDVDHIAALLGVNVHEKHFKKDTFNVSIQGP